MPLSNNKTPNKVTVNLSRVYLTVKVAARTVTVHVDKTN